MDFVFRPEIAALIAAYVNYVTPVPGAQQELLDMAEHAATPEEQEELLAVANGPLVFPDEADLAGLKTYRELATDDELSAWNDAFSEFYV
jgi:spermidine/putrescine transport system substrate-binding protein